MTATALGHNPNATADEVSRHVEDLSLSKHHPDPAVRRAAQDRLDANGSRPSYNDFTPEQKAEFERLLREQNSRRGTGSVQVSSPTAETKITLEQIRELARSVYGFELVPIGDKPNDSGWAARAEAEKSEMQRRLDDMYIRATTAERTAADAIRELNTLKQRSGEE